MIRPLSNMLCVCGCVCVCVLILEYVCFVVYILFGGSYFSDVGQIRDNLSMYACERL